LAEDKFCDLEDFASSENFLAEVHTYQLCFNLAQANSHKESRRSWQIIMRLARLPPVELGLLSPDFLNYYPLIERLRLTAGDGGCGGACGESNCEPFCGALHADQEGSPAGSGFGGVAFVLEGCGASFFVGQIFLQGVVLQSGGAAVLQIVEERDKVGLGDRDGGGGSFAGRERAGEVWLAYGNREWERREDGGNGFGGLLRGFDGLLLRLDGGEGGGELRVALLFLVGCLLDDLILRGECGGELLGVATGGSPGVGEQGYGERGG
jgi:hypothetical protein